MKPPSRGIVTKGPSAAALKVGRRIKNVRLSKNLTQEQFGEECGCTREAVAQWEGGRVMPGYERLETIAKLCNTTVEWLRKGRGTPPVLQLNAPALQSGRAKKSTQKRRQMVADIKNTSAIEVPQYPGVVVELLSSIGVGAQPGEEIHDWWRFPPGLFSESMRSDPADVRIFRVGADPQAGDVRKGDRIGIDTSKTAPVDGQLYIIDNGIGYLLKRLSVNGTGAKAGDVEVKAEHIVGLVVFNFRMLV